MAKYNVGDKVRIVPNMNEHWNPIMKKWCEKVMTIREHDGYSYRMKEDIEENDGGWYWQEKDFVEKLETDPCKIKDGKVMCIKSHTRSFTVGKIYTVKNFEIIDNDKFAWSPCGCTNGIDWLVKRHPSEIEFEVIFDEESPEETPKTKFKVGDKVIGNAEANKKYGFTRKGWIGTIQEVKSNGFFKADGFHNLDPECFDLLEGKPEEERDFKVGDRVEAIAPVGNDDSTGVIGTIRRIEGNERILIEFDEDINGHDGDDYKDGHCWWVDAEDIELVKDAPKKKTPYYNGKIMCIDNCNNVGNYTVGKIYEVVDGWFVHDGGGKMGCGGEPIKSFSDFERFTTSKFKEVKDEKTPEAPVGYNGKVVCVSNRYPGSFPIPDFTIGKVYVVTNGQIVSDHGFVNESRAIDLEHLSRIMGNTFVKLQM